MLLEPSWGVLTGKYGTSPFPLGGLLADVILMKKICKGELEKEEKREDKGNRGNVRKTQDSKRKKYTKGVKEKRPNVRSKYWHIARRKNLKFS
jgi:hypothetical protein